MRTASVRPLRSIILLAGIALGGSATLAAVGALWASTTPAAAGPSHAVAGVALVMAVGFVSATVLRASRLAADGARAVARLPVVPAPTRLRSAAQRAGLPDVRCVAGPDCTAFCAGALRPRVYVTTGAVHALTDSELTAVLVHEATHRVRRDPLRRLLAKAASDAAIFLPPADNWLAGRMARAELIADRAAVAATSPGAVAGALWTAAGGGSTAAVGFENAVRLRLARLSGPVRSRGAAARMVLGMAGVATVAGLLVAACLVANLSLVLTAHS